MNRIKKSKAAVLVLFSTLFWLSFGCGGSLPECVSSEDCGDQKICETNRCEPGLEVQGWSEKGGSAQQSRLYQNSRIALMWNADRSERDFYIFGSGSMKNGKFLLRVRGDLPLDALSPGVGKKGSYGLAFVVVYSAEEELPKRPASSSVSPPRPPVGIATRYVVVYKANRDVSRDQGSKISHFGAGFSCAKVEKVGKGYDRLEPTPCSDIQVNIVGKGVAMLPPRL